MSFLERFFGARSSQGSKDEAKARLKMVLMHDQVDLTPAQLEAMKTELVAVIARYVEVDQENVDLRLEKAENRVSVISKVPVRRVNVKAG